VTLRLTARTQKQVAPACRKALDLATTEVAFQPVAAEYMESPFLERPFRLLQLALEARWNGYTSTPVRSPCDTDGIAAESPELIAAEIDRPKGWMQAGDEQDLGAQVVADTGKECLIEKQGTEPAPRK